MYNVLDVIMFIIMGVRRFVLKLEKTPDWRMLYPPVSHFKESDNRD